MYPLSHSSRFPKTAILGRGGEDEKPTASPLVADLRGYCRLYDVVAFFGQTGATALPGRFARPRHLSAPRPRGKYGPGGHPNYYWRNSPPKQKENGGGNHKRKTRPGAITIEKTRNAHLTLTEPPDRGRNEKRKKGRRSRKQDGTRRTKKRGKNLGSYSEAGLPRLDLLFLDLDVEAFKDTSGFANRDFLADC